MFWTFIVLCISLGYIIWYLVKASRPLGHMRGQSSAAESIQNQVRSGQHVRPEKESDLGFFSSCRARSRTQTSDFRSRAVPGDNLEADWSGGVCLESTGHTPCGSTTYKLWDLSGHLWSLNLGPLT